MEKLSFYDLQEYKSTLEKYLKEHKDNDRNLVYGIRKNIKLINSEQQTIKDDLPEDVEGYSEYNNKLFNVLVECGAKPQELPNGRQQIKDFSTIDEKKAAKKRDKLIEEYKEVLDKQQKVVEKREEILNDKIVELNFHRIKLEYFPEVIDDLPQILIDLIDG